MATQPVSRSGAVYSRGGAPRTSPSRPVRRLLGTYASGAIIAPGTSRPLSRAVQRHSAGALAASGARRPLSRALSRFSSGGILSLLNLRVLSSAVSRYLAGSFQRFGAGRALGRSYSVAVPTPPPPPPEPSDATPPIVGNYSPLAGTPIAKTTSISFDVTEETGAFRRVFVVAFYSATGISELIHDGDGFRGFYSTTSARRAIAGGFRYTVLRAGGWPAAPTIQTFAIDLAGNEAEN